jgi:beta-phosphoglucomutase
MKKKGFIFDLDGVIVDTAKYHFLAWRRLADSIDVDFTEELNEQLKGVSRIKSLEKILEWGNKSISKEQFTALMGAKNEEYLLHVANMDASEILPDVPKILNFLKEKGQPIGLGSASKNARGILEKVQLLNYFDAIVDGTNVANAKPDPEVFLNAASLLGVAPENCIVFEDAVAGVQAANAANMISIGIGKKETLKEADFVFNDFTEISKDFIEKLIKR